MFYSNSSVCDKAKHYVGPSSGSEDEAGGHAASLTETPAPDYMQILPNVLVIVTLRPLALGSDTEEAVAGLVGYQLVDLMVSDGRTCRRKAGSVFYLSY